MRKRILLLIAVSLSGAACSDKDKPPENLLPEDTYTRLLAELHVANNLEKLDTDNQEVVDSVLTEIFSEYDTNEEHFRESHYFYQKDLQGQIQRIEKIQKTLRDAARHITTVADSIKKTTVSRDQEKVAPEEPTQE